MPATAAWLACAEAVLNRQIDASTPARTLARRLERKSLQVDIEGLTRIRVTTIGGRLALLAGDDSPPDALICGTPAAMVALLAGRSPRRGGGAGAQVRGDAEVAGLYRELFALARPDWEEELSRWIGDVPARRLAGLANRTLAWVRSTSRTAGENLAEYWQEESRDLVNKTEHEEFLRGVDELRETADRVEARIARLERRLQGAP